jgi:hypothetical protein
LASRSKNESWLERGVNVGPVAGVAALIVDTQGDGDVTGGRILRRLATP